MRLSTVALLIVLAALPCAGQGVVDGFIGRIYRSGPQSMPYRLFVPPGYKQDMQYPLVLWLHGAGGAGTDNRAQISAMAGAVALMWTSARPGLGRLPAAP